jgi:hypothetical protein
MLDKGLDKEEYKSVVVTELAVVDREIARLGSKREALQKLLELEGELVLGVMDRTGESDHSEEAPPKKKRGRRTNVQIAADNAAAEAAAVDALANAALNTVATATGEEAAP